MAEPAGGREHDESDIDVAEDGELVGFLDEAITALRESHLPVRVVLYPLYLQLHPPHQAFHLKPDKKQTEDR